MGDNPKPSLTGSESGAPATHTLSVATALGRLRGSVVLCCWCVAAALVVQMVIWGLATFTELRWEQLEAGAEAALVVSPSSPQSRRLRSAFDDPVLDRESTSVNPNRVLTTLDRVFNVASSLASGFGLLSVLSLAPLVGLGVLLAAGSGTSGVDKAVSAFGWTLIVSLLCLPLGQIIGLPWREGALWEYAQLTAEIDRVATAPEKEAASLGLVFYARFVVLPLACGCALGLVAFRFGAGVEAGVLRKENLVLDAALEAEAGNIKSTTLHGGRAAGAMRTTMDGTPPTPDSPVRPSTSTVRQLSAGTAPKRLI